MRLALCSVAMLALAGCSGSAAGPSSADSGQGSAVAATGASLPDAGSIAGTVVDDSSAPLEGATVALADTGLQAATDAAGVFAFMNLAPGAYTVVAVKLGYSSGGKQIQVAAYETTRVILQLVPLAVESEPWVEMYGPMAGYFECRMGTTSSTGPCGFLPVVGSTPITSLWSNDKSILRFNMTSDNYGTFVGEERWSPSAYGTSGAMRVAFSHDNRTSTHWWCSAEGPSPIQFRFEKEGGNSVCANRGSNQNPPEPTTQHAMRVYANVPFGSTSGTPFYLTLQQRFEILVSVFYVEPAPQEYTGFPDG